MDDWFIWNGENCTEFGMHVLQQPQFVIPNERLQSVNIPGKSGSLTLREAKDIYDDLNLSCMAVIDSPYYVDENSGETINRISRIAGWLKGHSTVEFANKPDGFYDAWIANQIPFEKVVRGDPHMTFAVQFRCKPFFYLNSGMETVELNTSQSSRLDLTNLGNISSLPLIKVEGTGIGTITFVHEVENDGQSSFVEDNTLPSMDIDLSDSSYIMLDCDAKIAYKGSNADPLDPLVLLGTRVTGEWIYIPTGDCILSVSGDISKVTITPRWRCI